MKTFCRSDIDSKVYWDFGKNGIFLVSDFRTLGRINISNGIIKEMENGICAKSRFLRWSIGGCLREDFDLGKDRHE